LILEKVNFSYYSIFGRKEDRGQFGGEYIIRLFLFGSFEGEGEERFKTGCEREIGSHSYLRYYRTGDQDWSSFCFVKLKSRRSRCGYE
jgi:hypothetical protein